MITEALRTLETWIREAAGAKGKVDLVDLPGDKTSFGIVRPDGTLEIQERLPQPRNIALSTVESVAEFYTHASENLDYDEASIWYAENKIAIVLDDGPDGARRSLACCTLENTGEWDALLLAGENWYPQKQFVRLLRNTFGQCATDSSRRLLHTSRIVAFSQSVAGHGKIEHGRESLGRDIEADVRSEAGDIPEEITLNVRIFTDPYTTARHEIRCLVDVNAREGTFNLSPLEGDLNDAIEAETARIVDRLKQTGGPVFLGQPNL